MASVERKRIAISIGLASPWEEDQRESGKPVGKR